MQQDIWNYLYLRVEIASVKTRTLSMKNISIESMKKSNPNLSRNIPSIFDPINNDLIKEGNKNKVQGLNSKAKRENKSSKKDLITSNTSAEHFSEQTSPKKSFFSFFFMKEYKN